MIDWNMEGMFRSLATYPDAGGMYGVLVGVVTNNEDPDGLGRVKVRFPWLAGDDVAAESNWARVATPMAGPDRGLYFLPEVDDEVLVAFEHGKVEFPYVLGALWNGTDAPPETNDGANDRRTIKSRSGHVITLDDTDGAEKIEITDSSGNNSIVISTADNTTGRVKVRFPWLAGDDVAAESNWARVATPMAGPDRGLYFLPEVDDEVLVAFEHGKVEFPYVLGALWNGTDAPPETNDGANDRRTIKSRSGHVITLDDTDGAEKIEITDSSGNNSIVISTADNTITIKAESDITIEAGGALKLVGNGITISSQAEITAEAGGTMDLKSDQQVNIKGATVNIN